MDSAGGASLGRAEGEIFLSADGALRGLDSVKNGLQDLDRQAASFGSGLRSNLQSMQTTLNSWGESLRNAGKTLTTGITLPLAAAGGVVVNWAADLDESINKTTVLFGDATDEVIAFSRTTSRELGMSQQASLDFASSFAGMLKPIAANSDELASMSLELTTLAADFGSFNNLSPEESFTVISSALAGETEAIRRFGVDVSAAAVEQKALEEGLAGTAAELTEQDKLYARYLLILEQTTDAQGDFERTQDSTSNKLKTARARLQDVGAGFGRLLLPYVNTALDLFSNLVDWLENLDSGMRKWILGIAAAAAAIGPLLFGLGVMLPALGALAGAIAFLISPIGLIVIGIAALAAGLIYAYTHWEPFREAVDATAAAIKDFITGALDKLIDGWNTLKDAFDAEGWSGVWDVILSGIQAFADSALQALSGLSDRMLGWVQGLADNFIGWAVGLAVAGAAWIQSLWDGAVGKWNEFTGWLAGLASGAVTWIGETVSSLWQKGTDLIQGLWDGATGKWEEFTTWVTGLFTGASEWIGDTLSTLYQKGVDLITGLWNGALALWVSFTAWLPTLPGLIAGALGDFLMALYQKGVDLVTGLWNGMLALWVSFYEWLATLPVLIVTAVGDFLMTLYQKGVDLITGLWNGAIALWASLYEWLGTVPTLAFNAIGDTLATLYQRGVDLIQGLWNGVLELWATVSFWFQNLPTMATNAIGDVLSTLWQKGQDLIAGLWNGLLAGWESLSGWLVGLPGLVAGAVGDMAGALVGAGQAVMDGFLSGLQAGWDEVTGWLSGLNPADWKGPEQRDRKMLYKPGIWIMEGLERGLEEGWADVTRQLRAMTPQLAYSITGNTSGVMNSMVRPAPIPAAAYASPAVSHVTTITYGPTILTIPPDDWVKYARMAETAPARTIRQLDDDYARMGMIR